LKKTEWKYNKIAIKVRSTGSNVEIFADKKALAALKDKYPWHLKNLPLING
jgi:hypothetical protein